MERRGRIVGWVAVGIGAMALVVALLGLGSRFVATAPVATSSAAQAQEAPARTQERSSGRQSAPSDRSQTLRQGPATEGQPRQGPHRGGGVFGWFGWLLSPFWLSRWLFQQAALVGLVLLAFWLIRRRNTGRAAGEPRAEPPQESSETRGP